MRPFECEPGMEISGQLAISMLHNMQSDSFKTFLAKNGLTEIIPEQWYPFQSVLNVFRDVAQQRGATFDFVAVGLDAVDRYDLPPQLAGMSLEEFFLNVLPKVPGKQYRNGESTQLLVEKVGEHHLLIRAITAYPDDTVYGFVYGFARRFAPRGTHFTVKDDEQTTRRDQGGEETLLHLTW